MQNSYGCVLLYVIFVFFFFFLFSSLCFFFFQAEDGIRDLVRSRGLRDVYKRQELLPDQPGRGGQLLDGLGDDRRDQLRAGRQVLQLSLIHI